jgi:hypothetical protein
MKTEAFQTSHPLADKEALKEFATNGLAREKVVLTSHK